MLERIVALLMLFGFAASCSDPPADRDLINHFRQNRSLYEHMVDVVSDRPYVSRIEFIPHGHNVEMRTTLSTGGESAQVYRGSVDPERRAFFEEFFRRTRIDTITAGPSEGPIREVDFVNYRSGLSVSGTAKGIGYRANNGFLTEEDGAFLSPDCLDKYTRSDGRRRRLDSNQLAYCRINDNWYVFLSM